MGPRFGLGPLDGPWANVGKYDPFRYFMMNVLIHMILWKK
jgi:hypothetical protein